MSTFGIILLIYCVVAIGIAIFVLIRSRKPLTPLDNLLEKKRKPLWQILLPLPIYPVAGVFYGIILLFDPKERRNLFDKKVIKTQKDFDMEYEELNVAKIDIEEGMDEESPHKKAGLCLAKELQSGKVQGFSSLLDENVVQINYDEKYFNQFKGKLQVIQYWNNWIEKQAEQEHTHKYSIVCAKYFSSEAVQIDYYNKEKRFNGSMLVVFSFNEQEKIQRVLFTRDHIYYTHFKEEKYSPLVTLESLTPNLIDTEFKKSNHLPCMRCGKESSELIWLGYSHIAYGGNISFCPNCGDEVERYCYIHYYVDYEHDYYPINDNIGYIEKRLSDETSAIEAISPIVLGTRGMVFEEPDMEVLAKLDNSITGTKIDSLSYAAEHGIYEAYNNLGIEMLGKDDDKAIEYFKLGVEHGVATSMLNLSLWYYGHKDYPNFEYYSKLAAEANSLVGMYNHATNLAWPSSKEPMIYEATSLLIRTVEKCLEQEIKHNMNQNVDDDSWTMVQHWSYYALAYIYYKEYGSYQDLLKAYAYLNECKTQTNAVRDLKACIYEDLQEMKEKMKVSQDYDDLPF